MWPRRPTASGDERPAGRRDGAYAGFGIGFAFAAAPRELARAPGVLEPTLEIDLVARSELDSAWSGAEAEPLWSATFPGGERVVLERGRAGDHLYRVDDSDRFLLVPGTGRLLCAVASRESPRWRQFVLDTVLWSVSLLRGNQALHAGALDWDGGVVAIAAPQGGGKTSLVAELAERGRSVFTDDVLALDGDEPSLAHPGPGLMNLPASRTPPPGSRTIAVLDEPDGDEAWTALAPRSPGPRPLSAIVVIRPTDSPGSRLVPCRSTALDLLPHSLSLGGAAVQRRRFEAIADVCVRVPLLELWRGHDADPATLADRLEADLGREAGL